MVWRPLSFWSCLSLPPEPCFFPTQIYDCISVWTGVNAIWSNFIQRQSGECQDSRGAYRIKKWKWIQPQQTVTVRLMRTHSLSVSLSVSSRMQSTVRAMASRGRQPPSPIRCEMTGCRWVHVIHQFWSMKFSDLPQQLFLLFDYKWVYRRKWMSLDTFWKFLYQLSPWAAPGNRGKKTKGHEALERLCV